MRGDGETYLSRYIQKQGYKTIFNPKATVFHWISEKRMTLEYLYKRMFLQGISDSYTYIRNYNRIGDLKQYEIKTDSIQDVLHKAHCNGYNYHHSEVQNDPELLKWVLKDNYMDYKMTKEDLLYG
jgi:type IV secretory pathway VirD2 relaxase